MSRLNHIVPLCLVAGLGFGCKTEPVKPSTTPEPTKTVVAPPKTEGARPADKTPVLEKYSCGTVERLHTWNGIFAGSQPAADDLRHAQANGIKTIFSLRPESENPGFDEAALVKELGMEYQVVPFASAADMTDEALDRARALLRDESKRPMFFHCHSGNRVGAVWMVFRALDGGQTIEAATSEAKEVGLKTPALEQRALEYIERQRATHDTK